MKRIIAIVLAMLMMLSMAVMFASCDEETENEGDETEKVTQGEDETTDVEEDKLYEVSAADIFNSVNGEFAFDEKTSYSVTKADDIDEMIMMQYGIVDIEAADKLTDYAFTMPGDYCNTFAIFVFEEKLSEAALAELKDVVSFNYTESRASALQMYMPEEYAKMSWAVENEDLTWKVFGNVAVFAITGDSQPTDVFNYVEGLLK